MPPSDPAFGTATGERAWLRACCPSTTELPCSASPWRTAAGDVAARPVTHDSPKNTRPDNWPGFPVLRVRCGVSFLSSKRALGCGVIGSLIIAMRAPFQVLVLLFRRVPAKPNEFAVLCRADDGCWQGVAGGGEDDETPVQAARRELTKESGVPSLAPLYRLKTFDHVPVGCFAARDSWPPDIYVVPQHFFACEATGWEPAVSREHSELRWCTAVDASALLRYDSNRTALWELARRLERNDLPIPCGDH